MRMATSTSLSLLYFLPFSLLNTLKLLKPNLQDTWTKVSDIYIEIYVFPAALTHSFMFHEVIKYWDHTQNQKEPHDKYRSNIYSFLYNIFITTFSKECILVRKFKPFFHRVDMKYKGEISSLTGNYRHLSFFFFISFSFTPQRRL